MIKHKCRPSRKGYETLRAWLSQWLWNAEYGCVQVEVGLARICSHTILLIHLTVLKRAATNHTTLPSTAGVGHENTQGVGRLRQLKYGLSYGRPQSYVILMLEWDCFMVGCGKDMGNICMLADWVISWFPAIAGIVAPAHCTPYIGAGKTPAYWQRGIM